jgi:thiosulfate dehydrogenase (quinone) large subunit
MVSTPARSTRPPAGRAAAVGHLLGIVRFPFTSRLASPLWLLVRLYLAYVWFSMGYGKLSAGFLTADPIGDLLRLAGDGVLPVPFEAYRGVAAWLVDLGVTPLLSHGMPFLEMAVALAFVGGVLLVPAALGATFLNLNFLLSGVAIAYLDIRVIVLQLLLVLAWRVAGTLGVRRPLVGTLTGFGTLLRTRYAGRPSHPSV